ncbi:PTS system sorbose subfamily IIB component [Clostridium sp. DL-VIII]|uniref:PTS system mannose/fructose/N-acetylgalactosamine-transporter subunit IIB n=1 Tax=Clostridium sp. DL-VIII TaxID=641107 RepID=UPI00023B016F|nr:PTS sugar transporter subunit IIB [Clostridium sp. DL-VIII]EHI99229.1 PTS system sorbose subfamily IIB component [Clostridium sp. DL-VIII]
MAIEFIRIDDRLIHGQVVTTWVKELNIEQIIIINNEIAKDQVQKSVFAMMAPHNVKIGVFGVDQFSEIIKTNPIKRRTLLLLTNPIDVLHLVEGGCEICELNLGGMKFGQNRRQITKAVSINSEEENALKKLIEKNLKITVQMIPSEQAIDIKKLI